jgi:hypothetical protein
MIALIKDKYILHVINKKNKYLLHIINEIEM